MSAGSSLSGAERRAGNPRAAEGSTGLIGLPHALNKLHVGFSRNVGLPEGGCLFIDDEIRDVPRARVFDPLKDRFNPMRGMDERKARALSELLYSVYPQGETTLTVRNGKRDLAPALLKAKRLDEVTGSEEVEGLIADLMFSPVLRRALCGPTDFSFNPNSKIMARLNRAELGDFDALVLGFFLIAQFKGTVVIPDAAFYLRDAHVSLIRENRLVAGANFLGELPERLRSAALLIEDKEARGATFDDAVVLAKFSGHRPDPQREDNPYNRFIEEAMS